MPPKNSTKNKNLLKCQHCDYTTPRKAFMDDHVRIHTGDRPYRCEECGKGFTQKSNLTKHQIVHGAGYKTEYKCDKCDFVTRYKQSLKMHQNWHDGVKPYACKICDRTFSQSTHRRTHMKEAHGDERKYQCHLCSKCFKRKEHLDKHIAFHKNERNYSCDICGKKFIEEKHVAIHKLIHGGEETKIHQCDLCPYKSRYKQGLQVHYRIHLGLRPYKCEQCPKAFRTSQTLRIHKCMVHQGLLGKKYQCNHCDYKSANKQSLKKHIENIHIGIKKEGKQYPCPYCGNIYQSHASVHGHKRKKHPLKLRQEMQNKLQSRLSMIRNSDNQEFHNSKFDAILAVADYRFTNSVHQSLKESFLNSLKKPKNDKKSGKSKNIQKADKKSVDKKKIVKTNSKTAKSTSVKSKADSQDQTINNTTKIKNLPKNKSQTPKKEPVTPMKVKTPGSSKKPVHDLLQERIAKKNQLQKFKASRCIDFVKESEKQVASEDDSSNNPKVSYMSGLGLLQCPENASALSESDLTSSQTIRALGTIQLAVVKDFSSQNNSQDVNSDQLNTNKTGKPKKTAGSFPKIKAMKVSKKASAKKPGSPKMLKPKSSPRENVHTRKVNSSKSTNVSEQPPNPTMIVYEPVDVPSLGPYSNQSVGCSPVFPISPESGSLIPVSEIKTEQVEGTSVETQLTPVNYSMKEYDSLRDLASVYLGKRLAALQLKAFGLAGL